MKSKTTIIDTAAARLFKLPDTPDRALRAREILSAMIARTNLSTLTPTDRVLEAFKTRDTATAHEISEATGIRRDTVQGIAIRLNTAGEIHIVAWGAISKMGPKTKIYKYGPGKDAPYPYEYSSRQEKRKSRKKTTKKTPRQKLPVGTGSALIDWANAVSRKPKNA